MNYIFKFLVGLLLLAPQIGSAHGLVTTLTQVSGDYTVEFEYNTLGTLFTGDYTIFSTYLLKQTEPVSFDSAFMRIQKLNGPATMAGSLARSTDTIGLASMSSAIHEAGTYTAEVSFYADDKKIAGGEFEFNVKDYPESERKGMNTKLFLPIGLFILGLSIGSGGIWMLTKGKKHG